MKCNGKVLTEQQVDTLQYMIHNYYNKGIDICSCDVERALYSNRKEHTPARIQNDPLLIIEVQDMKSVPSITYRGEDIKGKVSINYEWETKRFGQEALHNLKIKHFDNDRENITEKTIQEELIH
ncbi:hypothetical protein COE56_30505 [Bacillus anthracis]|nr:hypothetical protein COE56_30505 [Bacillus anthracis]